MGGLTTDEIARAYLKPEATIAQRIVRAKRTTAGARCSRSSTSSLMKATPPLLPAVRGDLLMRLERLDEARAEFEHAAWLTRNSRERALLMKRANTAGTP